MLTQLMEIPIYVQVFAGLVAILLLFFVSAKVKKLFFVDEETRRSREIDRQLGKWRKVSTSATGDIGIDHLFLQK